MDFDEIRQAAANFAANQGGQQSPAYQSGETVPGLHGSSSYSQAEAMAKAHQGQGQPQNGNVVQMLQQQLQQQGQVLNQVVEFLNKGQAPAEPAKEPEAPKHPTSEEGYKPITNDQFQKALSLLDNELVPDDMRSEPVQKAIDQDATGFLVGITEKMEEVVANITKAQNQQTAALGQLVRKAIEDVQQLRTVVEPALRAPVREPRGMRNTAAPDPVNKAFVNTQGQLGQGQGAPGQQDADMSKAQINRGFDLLIRKAGEAHDSNPTYQTAAELDRIGVESGNFSMTGRLSKSMRGRVQKVLEEHGLLH